MQEEMDLASHETNRNKMAPSKLNCKERLISHFTLKEKGEREKLDSAAISNEVLS